MKPFLQYECTCLPHQLCIKPPESIFAEGPWKTEARKEFLGLPIGKMPLKKLHSYVFCLPAPHDEQRRSTLRPLGEIKSMVKKIAWIHWTILSDEDEMMSNLWKRKILTTVLQNPAPSFTSSGNSCGGWYVCQGRPTDGTIACSQLLQPPGRWDTYSHPYR